MLLTFQDRIWLRVNYFFVYRGLSCSISLPLLLATGFVTYLRDKMLRKLCVLTLICQSLNSALHGSEFKSGSNESHVNCVDVSKGYVRSSVECALLTVVSVLYNHGFVYRDGWCYVCRSDNANCGKSREEVLLKGPHHIKGKRLCKTSSRQLVYVMTTTC